MSRRRTLLTAAGRHHADATSRGMRASARRRACPKCKRLAAIKIQKVDAGGGWTIVVKDCRYCHWHDEDSVGL